MPKNYITDQELIELLDKDHYAFHAYWSYFQLSDPKKLTAIGYYWRPFIGKPAWTDIYDITVVREKAYHLAQKTQFLSSYIHALGLVHFLEDKPTRLYSIADRVITKDYSDTVYAAYLNNSKMPLHLTRGYYNLSFQESLYNSLVEFQKQITDEKQQRILDQCCKYFISSMQYYDTFQKTGQIPKKQIQTDLTKGAIRIFFGGRTSIDFHATSFILGKNFFATGDRFDTQAEHTDIIPLGMTTIYKKTETHRSPKQGVYIYKLNKSFPSYAERDQKTILDWMSGESISRKDTLFSLPKILEVQKPSYTLPGQYQKYGNCRYASKKQGIAALMALSAIDEIEDEKEIEMTLSDIVYPLQKNFKLFDRLYKMDKLRESKLFTTKEKDHLFILTLFRNYNPSKLTQENDRKINEKIIIYFQDRIKESPDFLHNLGAIFEKIEKSLVVEKDQEWLDQLKLYLKEHDIIALKSGSVIPLSLYPDEKEYILPPKIQRRKCCCGFFTRKSYNQDIQEDKESVLKNKSA